MEYIINYSRAGSLRRMRETIKDLDFIIATEEPLLVKEQLLKIDGIKRSHCSRGYKGFDCS